jgi:hypothetical protein
MRWPPPTDDRADRRTNPFRRARFEQLKTDLLRRLDRVCAHLSAEQRDALATEMTRLRVRVDYGWRGG